MFGVILLLALSVFVRPLVCLPDQSFSSEYPMRRITNLIRKAPPADAQKNPWHAALFHLSTHRLWVYVCGGTLINNKYVVTAHHCTLVSIDRLLVKLGLQDVAIDTDHSKSYLVAAIHKVKDKHLASFRNDIALVELEETVLFTSHILPACFVDRNVEDHEIGTVVGFGYTENKTISATLRTLSVPVINLLSCLKRHIEYVDPIDEYQLCAGLTNGSAVCNADSGGGLFFRRNGVMQLGGIVSFSATDDDMSGQAICQADGYAIYVNVYKYLPWIKKTITESKLRKTCGAPYQKSSMAMTIYKLSKTISQKPWKRHCVAAIISERYVLANSCLLEETYDIRVALCDADELSGHEFAKMYYRNVESLENHPTSAATLTLLRLNKNMEFDGNVQPICLPSSEELEFYVPNQLIIFTFENSPEVQDKILSRTHLAKCINHCLQHKELIASSTTEMLCFESSASNETSLIGFNSRWSGFEQSVLLETQRVRCSNNHVLLFKLNYENHINWIYEKLNL